MIFSVSDSLYEMHKGGEMIKLKDRLFFKKVGDEPYFSTKIGDKLKEIISKNSYN